MYRIVTGESIIYDSTDRITYPVFEPSLELALNDAGSLEFSIFPTHPLYDQLGQMHTFVKVFQDNDELFYGRVLTMETDMYGVRHCHCEGALTFLLDSEQDAVECEETIPEFISRCITSHNGQVEATKQFTVGQMTARKATEIDSRTGEVIKIKFKVGDYTNTKQVLENMILSQYGGFFRIRPNSNGPYYFDYVQDYGVVNTQRVKMAENIIEKTDSVSGENIFSILRPIGKDKLTIESLSQSDISIPDVVKDGNKLRLTNAIALYGNILHTERFPDIDDAQTLLKAAEEFITRRGTQLPANTEISFVDWHLQNPTIQKVSLGDQFTTIDRFEDLTMTVSNLHIDLENAANDTMTLKNQEEIEAEDPTSSSGSLSASYASQCTHIDYVYQFIREEENKLIMSAEWIQMNADRITQTVNQFAVISGVISVDSQNNLHVVEGSGLYVDHNHTSFGVWDESNLTGGIIVNKVNDGSTLIQIQATKVNLTGYVTADTFNAEIANIHNQNTGQITTHNIAAINGSMGCISASSTHLSIFGNYCEWKPLYVLFGINASKVGVPGVGQVVSDVSGYGDTIYYLGKDAPSQ